MLILYGTVLFTELRHIFTSGNTAFPLLQPKSARSAPIGPKMFLALFLDINRKHNPPQHARGHRGGPGYRPNIGKCSLSPALTTQKRPFGDLEGWCRTPYMGQEIFWCFFSPKSGAQTTAERAGARGEGALTTPFPTKKSPVGGQGSNGRAANCRLKPVLER